MTRARPIHGLRSPLETLVRQNPDSRVLRNWLYVALNNAGDSEAADRLTLENFGRFPNYLFARIAMAELHMQHDDLAQAAAVLDNKFDLKAMYPHRSVFHISEYLGLSALAVQYMMRTGNRQAAERLYEIMSQIAPDHPLTKKVKNVIMGSVLLRAIERLAKLTSKPRRRVRRVRGSDTHGRTPQLPGESA